MNPESQSNSQNVVENYQLWSVLCHKYTAVFNLSVCSITRRVYNNPQMWLVMHLVMSVCLSVCPVRALTSESLGLETLFLLAGTSSKYLDQVHILRSLGQGNGQREKTAYTSVIKYTHLRSICLQLKSNHISH